MKKTSTRKDLRIYGFFLFSFLFCSFLEYCQIFLVVFFFLMVSKQVRSLYIRFITQNSNLLSTRAGSLPLLLRSDTNMRSCLILRCGRRGQGQASPRAGSCGRRRVSTVAVPFLFAAHRASRLWQNAAQTRLCRAGCEGHGS